MPHPLLYPLLASAAVAVACATLSVFVVARQWAFVGEGLGHSGYGGAGTAWLLAALVPAATWPWLPTVATAAGCFAAAAGIGFLSRHGRVTGDAAVGVLLVGSLAWGFMGREIFRRTTGADPAGADALLFGRYADIDAAFALAATCAAIAIVACVVALRKEILAYCFDPALAQTAGVRTGLVHYGLMALLALATAAGIRIVGSVLVTALLVLPGATAGLVSRRLSTAITGSLVAGLTATVGGLLAHLAWPPLPVGPAVVLILLILFGGTYAWAAAARRI